MPVLFDFHGSGGNAHDYPHPADSTGSSWADIALAHGFAVVGGEALQFSAPPSPSPVPSDCVKCFTDAGCDAGADCTDCCRKSQSRCAATCGPEHVPFPSAMAAVCRGDGHDRSDGGGFSWHGGQWLIPEVQNETTGIVCDSLDLTYVESMISALKLLRIFDTSRVFFTGCSMGSAMTGWVAQCMHRSTPAAVTAFATQSTGLKIKGDGLSFPPDNYDGGATTWGECDECKWFPAPVVRTEGLKACVVDQTEDGFGGTVDFYESSLALHAAWKAAGMRTAMSIHPGGHCATHSLEWIANCLDDGTSRLLSRGMRLAYAVVESAESL